MAKVNEAIRELGYYGNSVARQLVSGRPETLGIVTTDTSSYGYAETISGIEREARARGMGVLMCVLDRDDHEAAQSAVSWMLGHPLAGVVVVDFDADAHRVVGLLPGYLPVVVLGQPHIAAASGRPYVALDEYPSAYEITKRLVDMGHTSVFVIAQPNNDPPERRSVGALDALKDAHLPVYPLIRCQSWHPNEGYRVCQELLAEYGDLVTAVVCPNDETAVGAMRAIIEAGLRVPEDVSVTGFDGIPLGEFLHPSVSTVRQEFFDCGRQAVNLLLDQDSASGAAPAHVDMQATVVMRESVAPPHPERGLRRPAPMGGRGSN